MNTEPKNSGKLALINLADGLNIAIKRTGELTTGIEAKLNLICGVEGSPAKGEEENKPPTCFIDDCEHKLALLESHNDRLERCLSQLSELI